MALVHVVIALALVEFVFFLNAVGRARGLYRVPAPATSGHEMFERYFRVQMNTLEQLVVFVPGMLMFASYASAYGAAALGLIFIVGRALYFRDYVRAPEKREVGFLLSVIPNSVLLVGGLAGAVIALVRHG